MTDRNFKITGDDVTSRTAVKGEDLDQNNTDSHNSQDKQQSDVNKQENNKSSDDSSEASSLDKSKTHVLNVSGIDSR